MLFFIDDRNIMFRVLLVYVVLFSIVVIDQCYGMEQKFTSSSIEAQQAEVKRKGRGCSKFYTREMSIKTLDLDKDSASSTEINDTYLKRLYCAIINNNRDVFVPFFNKLSREDFQFRNYPRQETLAHVALRFNRQEMFTSLVAKSCVLNVYILETSKNRDKIEVQQLPYKDSKNYQGRSLAHYAVIYNRQQALNYLREMHANLEAKDDNGMTPFALAVQLDHEAMVDNFLSKGVDTRCSKVDVCTKNKYGSQPLHFVQSVYITDKLLRARADCKAQNNFGSQPLHYARTAEIVDELYCAGADVCAKNYDGFSPLHYVKDIDIAKKLIQHGANPLTEVIIEDAYETPRAYIARKYRPMNIGMGNHCAAELIEYLKQAEVKYNAQQEIDESSLSIISSPVSVALRKSSDIGDDHNVYGTVKKTVLPQQYADWQMLSSQSLQSNLPERRTVNVCQLQNIECGAPRKNTADWYHVHVKKNEKRVQRFEIKTPKQPVKNDNRMEEIADAQCSIQ